jgi:hypothetical protein
VRATGSKRRLIGGDSAATEATSRSCRDKQKVQGIENNETGKLGGGDF